MIESGRQLPDAHVWIGPGESVTLRELASDGPVLLVFYLFDWSST